MNERKKPNEALKPILKRIREGPVSKDDLVNRLQYLFCWDEIPGNDSVRLIDFLKQTYSIDWVKTAKIEKIDDDRTIIVSVKTNYISLTLNKEKTMVKLILDDLRTDKFNANTMNGKLNIFLRIPRRTVEYNLKGILLDLDLIKTLPDGRYAWTEYIEDEDKIKNALEKLRKKFFGEPPLKAVAIEIKETPEKTRELLSKYALYEKPIDEEIEKSAKEIQRYLLWNCWVDQKLHERNFKKWGLEKGIEKLVYSEINGDSFSNLINKEGMPSVDEVSNYIKRFPELKVKVNEKKDQKTAYYEFEWSEDAKNLFKMLGGKLKPWEGTDMILLPRRLDMRKYNSYVKSIDRDPAFVLDKIKELAIYSVLSKEALKDCLIWIRNPDFKNRDKVFPIFRHFCQNTKDCEVLSPENEKAITEALAEIAFVEEIEESLSEAAIEVIKIFDGEIIRDRVKTFFLTTVKKGNKSLDYLGKIAKWICIDPMIKSEIMEELERIILKSSDEKIRKDAKNLLQNYILKF